MTLDELLASMERRRADTPVTLRNTAEVAAKAAQTGACTPDTPDTPPNDNERKDGGKGILVYLTTSHWWLFHYRNGAPKEVSYFPLATETEALAGEPDAIAAEPFEPIPRRPDKPLNGEDETVIRSWLEHINETDDEMIAAVMNQCQTDADARASFIYLAQQRRQ